MKEGLMKSLLAARIAPSALVVMTALSAPLAAQELNLESSEARAGYSIGVNIGMNLDSQGIASNVDVDALLAGIADGLSGDLKLTQEEVVTAIQELSARLET